MKTYFLFLILPFVLSAAKHDDLLLGNQDDHLRIVAHNRVLANVHGKPITVIDLMKRMDITFLRQFPEYTNSPRARYQYYLANWKRTLGELVDKELILADAKEMKLEVAGGDVRQEMEDLFGPNIILNLDKIGLSLDEATKIVSGDIAIRRMIFLKVTSKALGKVTPLAIRNHYETWSKENSRPARYRYRMLTLREKSPEAGAKKAEELYIALNQVPYEELSLKIAPFQETVSLSEEFTHLEKEIAPQNLTALSKLSSKELSTPIKQKSRSDNSEVWRLFYLADKEEESIPNLKESEAPIKEILLDISIGEEQKHYLNRLRRHYGITDTQLKELIPPDFVPFSLK